MRGIAKEYPEPERQRENVANSNELAQRLKNEKREIEMEVGVEIASVKERE